MARSLVLSRKKFIYSTSYLFTVQTGTDQDFHLQSALVQASLLLKHQPTGHLKRTQPLTSYPVSQSRVLPTKSRSWSRDSLNRSRSWSRASPTRKVGSAFFRTRVYFDSSPCFAHPTLLSVVGFLWKVRMLLLAGYVSHKERDH